jgi:hypothetical protein|tara:strand:+ start:184 stop:291 length:108 start_codon:yes stop_codon:yes gene_type:complete
MRITAAIAIALVAARAAAAGTRFGARPIERKNDLR